MAAGERRIIELQLADPHEMFDIARTDQFSEYRSFLTGVEFCISEIRAHATRSPIALHIELPAAVVEADTAETIRRTLVRYCEHRLAYEVREQRALRFD